MQLEQQITQAIRKCLNNKQMSQNQLSVLSGVSETSISRFLNGTRYLYLNDIARLATALGMSFEELIYYPQVHLISCIENDTLTIHCNNLSDIHTIIITHKP